MEKTKNMQIYFTAGLKLQQENRGNIGRFEKFLKNSKSQGTFQYLAGTNNTVRNG